MRKNVIWKKAVAVTAAGAMVFAMGGCGAEDGPKDSSQGAVSEKKDETEERLEKKLTEATTGSSRDVSVDKDETVYVIADAKGKAKNVIVSEWLKANGKSELTDRSRLTNIKNVKGDETFQNTAEGLKWSADGNDVYYRGNCQEDLPVEVQVTYYLDGKEIAPEELAGKSGEVRIRYDYVNKASGKATVDGKTKDVFVPFVMATGVILPTDTFRNVEVTNGELLSEGDNVIAFGMGMPGLSESLGLKDLEDLDLEKEVPDYFEIVADVEDFQIGMSMTVCSNNLLDLKEFDVQDSLDQLDEDADSLTDGANQLQDGSQKLYDGTGELKDGSAALVSGVAELNDGVKTYTDGVSEAKAGAGALAEGAQKLDDGAGNLVAGIETARNGAGELNAGLGKLNSSAPELVAGIEAAKNGVDQLKAGYEGDQGALQGSKALAAGLEELNQKVSQLALPEMGAGAQLTDEQKAAIAQQVTYFLENDETGKAVLEQTVQNYVATVTGLMAQNGVTLDPQTEAVLKAVLDGTFRQAFVNVYVTAYESGMQKGMDETVSQVMAQMGQLSPMIDQLKQAVGQLAAGSKALEGGMEALYGGTAELAAGMDTMYQASGELTGGVNALYEGSSKLNNGLGALGDGAGTLKNGTAELKSGAGKLNQGCMTLDSASNRILNGFVTLKDGTVKLDEGVSKLQSGALELKDGVVKFNDEGISKINSLIKDDLFDISDRMDAITQVNDSYELYGGIADGQVGREKFIIKIEGIE